MRSPIVWIPFLQIRYRADVNCCGARRISPNRDDSVETTGRGARVVPLLTLRAYPLHDARKEGRPLDAALSRHFSCKQLFGSSGGDGSPVVIAHRVQCFEKRVSENVTGGI